VKRGKTGREKANAFLSLQSISKGGAKTSVFRRRKGEKKRGRENCAFLGRIEKFRKKGKKKKGLHSTIEMSVKKSAFADQFPYGEKGKEKKTDHFFTSRSPTCSRKGKKEELILFPSREAGRWKRSQPTRSFPLAPGGWTGKKKKDTRLIAPMRFGRKCPVASLPGKETIGLSSIFSDQPAEKKKKACRPRSCANLGGGNRIGVICTTWGGKEKKFQPVSPVSREKRRGGKRRGSRLLAEAGKGGLIERLCYMQKEKGGRPRRKGICLRI